TPQSGTRPIRGPRIGIDFAIVPPASLLHFEERRLSMLLEMHCSRCPCDIFTDSEEADREAFDGLSEEGPWFALGDGETPEDRLYAVLSARGALHCPECGEQTTVTEESLGKLALSVLTQW